MYVQFAKVFPDLILFHQGRCPCFPPGLWQLGFLKAGLASNCRGNEGILCLSLSHVLCHQVPSLTEQWAHIFPRFPFVTCLLTEALLVFFDIPHQIPCHLDFTFPTFAPACSDSTSVFLPGYLSLLPPSVCFLFVFEFGQERLVHPRSPLGIFA